MTPQELADLAHLRRARDLMDRDYAQPLDVTAAASALPGCAGTFSTQPTEGQRAVIARTGCQARWARTSPLRWGTG